MNLFAEKEGALLPGRRILPAEDMEINAGIMSDTLVIENIMADHAGNGKIAAEMFESCVRQRSDREMIVLGVSKDHAEKPRAGRLSPQA